MKSKGHTQRKPSAHCLNVGEPAIKMMDRIYNHQKERKRVDLIRYNSLCGPVTITRTTKITTKVNNFTMQ